PPSTMRTVYTFIIRALSAGRRASARGTRWQAIPDRSRGSRGVHRRPAAPDGPRARSPPAPHRGFEHRRGGRHQRTGDQRGRKGTDRVRAQHHQPRRAAQGRDVLRPQRRTPEGHSVGRPVGDRGRAGISGLAGRDSTMTSVSASLGCIPEPHRETAVDTLHAVFGSAAPAPARAVSGGASGALIYRVLVDDRWSLLRIEARAGAMRKPDQYTCLALAAGAGVAPPVH